MANPFGDEEQGPSANSMNPYGDDQAQVAEPGFVTSVKRGFEGLKAGFHTLNASGSADMLSKLDRLEAEGDTQEVRKMAAEDLLFANHYNVWKADPTQLAKIKEKEMFRIGQSMQNVAGNVGAMQTLPASEELQRMQQAEGFGEAGAAFLEAPISNTTQIVGESLGGQGPMLPVTIGAGILAGPAGLAVTAGAGSALTEYGSGNLELLAGANIDLQDPAAVAKFMQSPEFKAAQANKMKKAAVVGIADGMAAGMAGVKLRPSMMGNIAAQTGLQMAAGGGGEALGSYYGDEEIKGGAVLAEMVGEIPGALTDVGTLTARKMWDARTLQKTADQKEKEALTGLNDVQTELADETTHENKKPRLTPSQARIVAMASGLDVDPVTALAVAGIETGGKYNFDAKNPNSSAHGIFQITDDTWNSLGGGDRNDPNLQLQYGVTLLKQTQGILSAKLGRDPQPFETYMGHLFGAERAAAIIQSNDNLSITDALLKSGAKNAAEIAKNNGMAGKTVGQVKALWRDKMEKQIVANGGNPEMNMRARASKEADAVPVEDDELKGLEDLDGMFEAMEGPKLTPEDIDAALREEPIEASSVNPEATMEADMLADDAVTDTQADRVIVAEDAEAAPTLPTELAGAKPRFGFGKNLFEVNFSNDVDKAAYIIANGATKSSRDADYLQFVMKYKGLTETEARLYGAQVRREVKELASTARSAGSTSSSITHGAPDEEVARLRADSFVSQDALGTRDKYRNQNDTFRTTPSKLPVMAGRDGPLSDVRLGAYKIQDGEVAAISYDQEHTPAPYVMAVRDTLQKAVDRFAPNARIALTFFTEEKDKISSYAELKRMGPRNQAAKGRKLYKINMRNATNLGLTDDGTRNSTTRVQISSAVWHEFGHVIVDEHMLAGMPEAFRQRFDNLAIDDYFTEEELAQLDPTRAAVLREYNELKWKAMNDPSFSAIEWGERWLSPWKTAHGIGTKAREPGILSFFKKFVGESAVALAKGPAKPIATAVHQFSEILSPHEYLAEQMARYAYSRGLMDNSPLAKNFFAEALQRLREFFKALKGERAVKPGVEFATWVDSLTATSEQLNENPVVQQINQEQVKAAKPKVKIKPKVAEKARTLVVEDKGLTERPSLLPKAKVDSDEVKTLAVPEYTDEQRANLHLLATDLKYMQKTNSSRYQHYMELIRANKLEEFYQEAQMQLPDEIADKIRFDTDVPSADANAPWRDVELNLEKIPATKNVMRSFKTGTWQLRRAQFFVMTMTQMAFKHPDIAGLQLIDMLMSNYKAFKSKLEFKGLEVADRWSKLGKEQAGLLEQALREEHHSGENWADLAKVNGVLRFVANERLQKYANEKGLDTQAVEVWLASKNAHLSHMNALQNVIKQKLATRYKGRPKTLQVKLQELSQIFEAVRNNPFLPQTRFGEYALHVKEETTEGPKILHVEFFETQAQRDEAMEQLTKAAGPKRKVVPATYSMSSSILRTLPPQLLSTYAQELEITEQQKKELRQIYDSITRNPMTRKYSLQLAGITGANKDLHRNFADFMWHSAGNISKLHYKEHFKKGLVQIQADMLEASEDGDLGRYDMLANILKFSRSYVDHIMNPADQFQMIRSIVVIKQLWGNIKTAIANVFSLVNLWSLAASQQGIGAGTVNVAGTTLKTMGASVQSVMNRVMRGSVEGAQVWNADTKWALDQAKSDGLLDESFAAQLATFAQNGTLARLNLNRTEGFLKKAIWIGMLPQHAVETFVRRTTLVNQFEYYLKSGMERPEAYKRARSDTYRTQGNNSLQNRPAFMRGWKSNFLIYFGFIQNQLYLFSGAQERARNLREAIDQGLTADLTSAEARKQFYRINKMGGETVKMWMAYAFLGGMMGIPGAENLDDIMELLAKKIFGTRFSLKEEAFKLAKYITDNAREIGLDVNPRSLVHGWGADVDLLWFGPSVDISGSIGMGNVMPGGNAVQHAGSDLGKFLTGAMGPLGSTLAQVNDAFGDDPSMLKKLGLFLPNVAINAAKTFDDWEKGVRAPSGGKITIDRQTGELRDLTTGENLVRLMGFQPDIISSNKEIHWMQKETQQYWTGRRNRLIAQVYEARLQGDREAIADAEESLKSFNEDAPGPMKITGKDLAKSMKRKNKLRQADERGRSRQKRFQRMDDEIAEDVRGR